MTRAVAGFSKLQSATGVFLVICLTLLLAACGDQPAAPTPTSSSSGNTGGTGTATPVAASSGPVSVNVDMEGFKFLPAEITIPAGSTITWTNKENFKHTVTEDDGLFDSGTMEKGATFSHKFDTPGTIGYFCKFHGSAGKGMFGRITVTAAGTGSAQASPTPENTAVSAPAPTDTALPPTPTIPPPTSAPVAVTATPAPAQPQPAGSVRFSDNLGQTDQILVSIDSMPARPAGKAAYAWLTGSAGGSLVSLGRLNPDANGSVSLKYSDPANGNLLATYDTFLVTNEDLETVPASPSADVALKGQLPPKALVHLRHLLVSFGATPGKIGLEVGLRGQVELLNQHAQFMRDAQASGNLAGVKLHAEHMVNIIEGSKGADYGDLNKDGKVTNPGDGFGLLPNGDQLGYLQGSKDHAELAATASDATADIKLHAGHVGVTVDNVTGWVTTVRDRALQVANASDLSAADPLVKEIVALSGQALKGVDLKGDGQILPVPGSGGAITSYQHAQLMAAISLQTGDQAAATAEPAPTSAAVPTEPVAPTATTAAPTSGSAVQISAVNFTFGDPVTVKVGTTITWTNLDDAPHTVTADDNSFDSGVFQKGQTFSLTFSKAGVFSYYCAIHGGPGGQGMSSKITVEP